MKTGTIDEVNKHVFSDPSSRPTYLSGIFNHGVYATSTFHSVHAGLANAFIGPSFPDLEALLSSKATPVANNTSTDSETPPSAHPSPSVPPPSTTTPSLVQAILACPELAAIHVTAEQLLHIQLQKLAVNAVINPLSAIFACRNGALFENPRIQPLMDILIAEISAILTGIVSTLALSNFGPSNRPSEQDLREWEKARETFGYPALRKQVWDVGEMVKENVSSMRQDVLAGRQTEIEYINGFLVRAGRALGAPCGVNGRIVEMVREGVTGVKDEEIYERFGLKG